jgi:putative PIN family toxin of toxin-antitoxin system
MIRVVVDTNVLISALIKRGKPNRLLRKIIREHTLIMSIEILAELSDVLSRDKFMVKRSQVNQFLLVIAKKSKIAAIRSPLKVVAVDPDDDAVISTAFYGKAEYIVTGDEHLLALKEFKNIQIITVNQMLNILDLT